MSEEKTLSNRNELQKGLSVDDLVKLDTDLALGGIILQLETIYWAQDCTQLDKVPAIARLGATIHNLKKIRVDLR